MIRGGQHVTVPATVTLVLRRIRPRRLSTRNAYLQWEVHLLETLPDVMPRPDRRIVARALDRHRARIDLLEGYEHARPGRTAASPPEWLRAPAEDRSLEVGFAVQGSVTLRVLLCMVAPERVVAGRHRRSSEEARHG